MLVKIEKIRNVHTHRRLLVFNCDISVVSIVRCFKILSFTIKLLSEHTSWTFPTFLFHLRLPSLSFTPDSCDNPLAPMSIHEAFRILTWSRDRLKILHPTLQIMYNSCTKHNYTSLEVYACTCVYSYFCNVHNVNYCMGHVIFNSSQPPCADLEGGGPDPPSPLNMNIY